MGPGIDDHRIVCRADHRWRRDIPCLLSDAASSIMYASGKLLPHFAVMCFLLNVRSERSSSGPSLCLTQCLFDDKGCRISQVKLCRFFKYNTVARTFVNTSAGFLTVLLLSPLYDTWAMHRWVPVSGPLQMVGRIFCDGRRLLSVLVAAVMSFCAKTSSASSVNLFVLNCTSEFLVHRWAGKCNPRKDMRGS